MATYPKIKINHSPVTSYAGTAQGSWVGAQAVAGQRGSLPTFNDGNSYFISKAGSDGGAGTAADPYLKSNKPFRPFSNITKDYSVSPLALTMTNTVPNPQYPCYPIPPSGDYNAGPFSTANFLRMQAGSTGVNGYKALSGATAFTIEGYFFFAPIAGSLSGSPYVWQFNDGGDENYLNVVHSTGLLQFVVNNVVISASFADLDPVNNTGEGIRYYYACVMDAIGSKLYVGTSPENLILRDSNTTPRTLGTLTSFYIGIRTGTQFPFDGGYLSRLFISKVARTSFPTRLYSSGTTVTSNLVGAFYFQNLPQIVVSPRSYVVYQDSGEYTDTQRFNFPYELAGSLGIYAADGQAPSFRIAKGATPGGYGAGSSAYVPVTASPSTTCYVSKAGNDGSGLRGNPAFPFLTVNAASAAMTTANDTVEITDSGVYTEDITVTVGSATFQASVGAVPILRMVSATPGDGHFTSAAVGLGLAGIIFQGRSGTSVLVKNTSMNTISLSFCSISSYGSVVDRTFFGQLDNCYLSSVANLRSNALSGNFGWEIFDSFIGSALIATSTNPADINAQRSTFAGNFTCAPSAIGTSFRFGQCKFVNAEAIIVTAGANVGFANCIFDNSSGSSGILVGDHCPTLAHNCLFSGALTSTFAIQAGSGGVFWAQDCAAINHVTGFKSSNTNDGTAIINNCSTLNCSTAGVDAKSGAIANGLADSGSGVAYQGGIVPSNSISDADFISTASGNENLTLTANSEGAFIVEDGSLILDAGIQAAFFDVVNADMTFNGLIFEGEINQEGGIRSSLPFNVEYCTFSGLGPYGIMASASSTISDNLLNVNGHAIKDGQYACSISYNAAYACGGAMIQHYGRSTFIDHNSAYACEYGQYDSFASSFSASSNNIFSSSGAFDYSGDDTLTFSCVGTLDPDRSNSLDTNSVRQDPLFADADAGDLRLQALARQYYFDSPCLQDDSSGADMGAFIFTYGAAATVWTLIDFGTTGYVNPDQVHRTQDAIKPAEGDREDGSIYSDYAAIKKGYSLTWDTSSNPMPLAQLAELISMYIGQDNRIQIYFGLGAGFEDATFGRSNGFEYEDLGGLYADSSMPEPLKSLTIRMA